MSASVHHNSESLAACKVDGLPPAPSFQFPSCRTTTKTLGGTDVGLKQKKIVSSFKLVFKKVFSSYSKN
eukprot:7870663-Pyramimonas_sp.AAC.1